MSSASALDGLVAETAAGRLLPGVHRCLLRIETPGSPEGWTGAATTHPDDGDGFDVDVAFRIASVTKMVTATAIRFLNRINRSVPEDLDVHVVVDNSSTHKTPAVHRWLVRHPRFTLHFPPTYSSWLNLVERWFGELTTKWLRRGTHRSVKELVAAIRTWITNWNDDPKPFVWHKTANEILDTLATYCSRISDSGH